MFVSSEDMVSILRLIHIVLGPAHPKLVLAREKEGEVASVHLFCVYTVVSICHCWISIWLALTESSYLAICIPLYSSRLIDGSRLSLVIKFLQSEAVEIWIL